MHRGEVAAMEQWKLAVLIRRILRGSNPLAATKSLRVMLDWNGGFMVTAAYIREYRQRRKDKATALLGGKCVACGAEDELEFDHVDPTSKLMAIASMFTVAASSFWDEVRKCQLLCKPCHLAKSRAEGSLSHPQEITTVHGTLTMYGDHRCRCDACRAAKRMSRTKEWRERANA